MPIGFRPSPKQHIRIWFEFYKLALDDPALASQVEASRTYYEPWGDLRGITFDRWWPSHSHLFDGSRVTVADSIEPSPAALFVRVPLGLAPSDAGQQVAELVQARQNLKRAAAGAAAGKSSKIGFSRFQLSTDAEFRGRSAEAALQLYRDIFIPLGRPPIGAGLAGDVTAFYRQRLRRKMPLTALSREQTTDFSDDQIRQLRRVIQRAEALTRAAALGDFPLGRTSAV